MKHEQIPSTDYGYEIRCVCGFKTKTQAAWDLHIARNSETLTVHVASESDPKLTYTLHAQGDVITCNCRGYSTAGHCKHQRALHDVLGMEKAT